MNETDSKELLLTAVSLMKSGDVDAAIAALGNLSSDDIDGYYRRQALFLRATLFERSSRFDAAESDLLLALEIPNQTTNETYSLLVALAEITASAKAATTAAVYATKAAEIALTTNIQSFDLDFLRIYPAIRGNLTESQAKSLSMGLRKSNAVKSSDFDLDAMSLHELVHLVQERIRQ